MKVETKGEATRSLGDAMECTCPAKDMPFGRCCKAPKEPDIPEEGRTAIEEFNDYLSSCLSKGRA